MRNLAIAVLVSVSAFAQAPQHTIVLHAARVLDIETGKMISPGEIQSAL